MARTIEKWKIEIPVDFGNEKDAGHQAIEEAREIAETYKTPSWWTAKLVSKNGLNYTFEVTRE